MVQGQSNNITVGQSVQNDTSPPLRDMKQKQVEKKAEKEANENPKVPATLKHKDKSDEAVQGPGGEAPTVNMPATSLNFNGFPFPGVARSRGIAGAAHNRPPSHRDDVPVRGEAHA